MYELNTGLIFGKSMREHDCVNVRTYTLACSYTKFMPRDHHSVVQWQNTRFTVYRVPYSASIIGTMDVAAGVLLTFHYTQ